MMLAIPDLLDSESVARIRTIVDSAQWQDGNATSGPQSALAKRNARMGSIDNAVGCWMRDQVIRLIPQAVVLKSLVALGKPPR